MTKQTDPMCVKALQGQNTALKQRIVELKKNDLAMLDRLHEKDSQIQELQRKIEQTVSEKETLVNETKCMVNKLEKRCEDYEKEHQGLREYIGTVETKLLRSNDVVNTLTQDLDNKQNTINEQQKELETANIELRHYRFTDEINQLLSDVATGLDSEIKSLMEEYGVETSDFSVKFVVEEEYEDE